VYRKNVDYNNEDAAEVENNFLKNGLCNKVRELVFR
jgi:hypothetical protein